MFGYDLRFFMPVSVLLSVPAVMIYLKHKPSKWYWLTFVFGLTYINCAIDKLFFPIFVDNIKEEFNINYYIRIFDSFMEMDIMQLILNIIVTMPLALVLKFLYRCKLVITSIMTIIFSVAIESVQLLLIIVLKPGNIWFDLSDVVLNLVGGLIGVGLLLLVQKICNKNKGRGTAFIKYVIDTIAMSN